MTSAPWIALWYALPPPIPRPPPPLEGDDGELGWRVVPSNDELRELRKGTRPMLFSGDDRRIVISTSAGSGASYAACAARRQGANGALLSPSGASASSPSAHAWKSSTKSSPGGVPAATAKMSKRSPVAQIGERHRAARAAPPPGGGPSSPESSRWPDLDRRRAAAARLDVVLAPRRRRGGRARDAAAGFVVDARAARLNGESGPRAPARLREQALQEAERLLVDARLLGARGARPRARAVSGSARICATKSSISSEQ